MTASCSMQPRRRTFVRKRIVQSGIYLQVSLRALFVGAQHSLEGQAQFEEILDVVIIQCPPSDELKEAAVFHTAAGGDA